MGKCVIIDANNLLWRYLSVYPDAREAIGQFMKCVQSVPVKMGLRFDHGVVVAEPLDKEREGDYKAHREPVNPEFVTAWAAALEILPHLPHSYTFAGAEEGDRLLARYIRHSMAEGHDTLVVTSDKDLCQFVRDEAPRVGMVRPDGSTWPIFREKGVFTRYKVPPSKMALYLTLAGDKADNIPGIPGWGPVNSAKVACASNSLPDLLNQGRLVNGKLMDSLLENWGKAQEYYAMIDLSQEPATPWPAPAPNQRVAREIARRTPGMGFLAY